MALTLVAFPAVVCAQIAEGREANLQPTPEIKKLFEAFAGDCDTSGNRERTQCFPKATPAAQPDRGGSAHWDGNKFVNHYEEGVDGKKLRFRDTFQDITANPHTLVFAWIKDDGSMKPVIISKSVRRSKHQEDFFPALQKVGWTFSPHGYAFCACRRRNVGTSRSSPGTSRATSRTFCWT